MSLRTKEALLQTSKNIRRTVDRIVTHVTTLGEPLTQLEKDGIKIAEIHPRFSSPRSGRWIEFPQGKATVVNSNDIVHIFDHSGRVTDISRVRDNPQGTTVYEEGESVFVFRNGVTLLDNGSYPVINERD